MVLTLENVKLDFDGFCVLDNINITIGSGEFICLLGPSGCGKTSTLRVLAGLETPAEGRVLSGNRIFSDENTYVPPEKRNIGFLFQDFALFPHLNVYDNIAFGLKGLSKSEIKDRVETGLKQVRMEKYIHAMPHQLSGGQQQRIALARALAPKPDVILLDEPFSGLDSGLRADIRDETLHILKNANVAGVMVTHDPEEAMFMADRIILMKDGSIVQDGKPEELYNNPRDHFAASFFGEINTLKGKVRTNQACTPLGNVPVEGFKDGDIVDVLIRPEHIIITNPNGGNPVHEEGEILATRYLGRDSLLHLCVKDDNNQCVHLHARVPGRFQKNDDKIVLAHMDSAHAHVFYPC